MKRSKFNKKHQWWLYFLGAFIILFIRIIIELLLEDFHWERLLELLGLAGLLSIPVGAFFWFVAEVVEPFTAKSLLKKVSKTLNAEYIDKSTLRTRINNFDVNIRVGDSGILEFHVAREQIYLNPFKIRLDLEHSEILGMETCWFPIHNYLGGKRLK